MFQKTHVLLTVPHALPENDALAMPVASKLEAMLEEAGLNVIVHSSHTCRYSEMDMNRPESLGTSFHRSLERIIKDFKPQLCIDVHSFDERTPRFCGIDIALLHTPDIQDRDFLAEYVQRLSLKVDATVQPSEYPNTVCSRIREFGVPPNRIMLAEHNNSGCPTLYAEAHLQAIKALIL